MSLDMLDRIVDAVLYEGYLLYPYRASAVKNRHRFNFGVLYPEAHSQATGDASTMQTECLVLANSQSRIEVRIRFLHLLSRGPAVAVAEGFQPVESIQIGEIRLDTCQEAVEREVVCTPGLEIGELCYRALRENFSFPSHQQVELLNDEDRSVGAMMRRQEQLQGAVDLSAVRLTDELFKITAHITNLTGLGADTSKHRDELLMRSLVSTHTILSIEGGDFVSLLDPPEPLRELANDCRNVGTYPVLVGDEGQRKLILSSPIILYDYPKVAPESAGNLFDGTEIDEILTLRILTLTDEEKQQVRQTDERARKILDRTESLTPEQMAKLHGGYRNLKAVREQKQ